MSSRKRNPRRFQRLIQGLAPHIVQFQQDMTVAPLSPPSLVTATATLPVHRLNNNNRPIVWRTHVCPARATIAAWLNPQQAKRLRQLLLEARLRIQTRQKIVPHKESIVLNEIDALLAMNCIPIE
jgi:hypothetical protein